MIEKKQPGGLLGRRTPGSSKNINSKNDITAVHFPQHVARLILRDLAAVMNGSDVALRHLAHDPQIEARS